MHHFMPTYEEIHSLPKNEWYPECHNDPNKLICDHCMNCWEVPCVHSFCDARNRCMCERTDCLCRPSHDHKSNYN